MRQRRAFLAGKRQGFSHYFLDVHHVIPAISRDAVYHRLMTPACGATCWWRLRDYSARDAPRPFGVAACAAINSAVGRVVEPSFCLSGVRPYGLFKARHCRKFLVGICRLRDLNTRDNKLFPKRL